MGSKLIQVLILVGFVVHNQQRCKIGDVIEVSPETAKSMVARGEAEYYDEEPDFAVLGKQPLIAGDPDEKSEPEEDEEPEEEELTPAQKAARTRARNAAKKAAEEAEG